MEAPETVPYETITLNPQWYGRRFTVSDRRCLERGSTRMLSTLERYVQRWAKTNNKIVGCGRVFDQSDYISATRKLGIKWCAVDPVDGIPNNIIRGMLERPSPIVY